ncbi:hypothetical protein PMAYCL1PPCAC_12208, partial [Pristionchus mayeri]
LSSLTINLFKQSHICRWNTEQRQEKDEDRMMRMEEEDGTRRDAILRANDEMMERWKTEAAENRQRMEAVREKRMKEESDEREALRLRWLLEDTERRLKQRGERSAEI